MLSVGDQVNCRTPSTCRNKKTDDMVGATPDSVRVVRKELLDGGALVVLVLDELHRRRLVHVDAVVAEPRKELVVVRPAEGGPVLHHPVLARADEGAALCARAHVPHNQRLLLVPLGRPRHEVVLARRKVEQLDAAVVDLELPLPGRAAPQLHAYAGRFRDPSEAATRAGRAAPQLRAEAVEGGEVGAAWRPAGRVRDTSGQPLGKGEAAPGRGGKGETCISAASRLPLGCLSAASRLPLGCLSAASRLPLGCLSAASRLPLGSISAASRQHLSRHHET